MTHETTATETRSADELRAQARELLIKAHNLDGKKLYAVQVTGSIMDKPDLFITLSNTAPTQEEAIELSGSAENLVADGRVCLDVTWLPLNKVF